MPPPARSPDWRWLTGREDSPWYDSVRIFRQDDTAAWPSVVGDLIQALGEFTEK